MKSFSLSVIAIFIMQQGFSQSSVPTEDKNKPTQPVAKTISTGKEQNIKTANTVQTIPLNVAISFSTLPDQNEKIKADKQKASADVGNTQVLNSSAKSIPSSSDPLLPKAQTQKSSQPLTGQIPSSVPDKQ
jgi:hypothetical protein